MHEYALLSSGEFDEIGHTAMKHPVAITGCAKSSGPFLYFQKQMKLGHINSTLRTNGGWLQLATYLHTSLTRCSHR